MQEARKQLVEAYIATAVSELIISRIWWLGVVFSVVGRTNEVSQHRARLVLGCAGLANHLGV